jgi:hypothetical protein
VIYSSTTSKDSTTLGDYFCFYIVIAAHEWHIHSIISQQCASPSVYAGD